MKTPPRYPFTALFRIAPNEIRVIAGAKIRRGEPVAFYGVVPTGKTLFFGGKVRPASIWRPRLVAGIAQHNAKKGQILMLGDIRILSKKKRARKKKRIRKR